MIQSSEINPIQKQTLKPEYLYNTLFPINQTSTPNITTNNSSVLQFRFNPANLNPSKTYLNFYVDFPDQTFTSNSLSGVLLSNVFPWISSIKCYVNSDVGNPLINISTYGQGYLRPIMQYEDVIDGNYNPNSTSNEYDIMGQILNSSGISNNVFPYGSSSLAEYHTYPVHLSANNKKLCCDNDINFCLNPLTVNDAAVGNIRTNLSTVGSRSASLFNNDTVLPSYLNYNNSVIQFNNINTLVQANNTLPLYYPIYTDGINQPQGFPVFTPKYSGFSNEGNKSISEHTIYGFYTSTTIKIPRRYYNIPLNKLVPHSIFSLDNLICMQNNYLTIEIQLATLDQIGLELYEQIQDNIDLNNTHYGTLYNYSTKKLGSTIFNGTTGGLITINNINITYAYCNSDPINEIMNKESSQEKVFMCPYVWQLNASSNNNSQQKPSFPFSVSGLIQKLFVAGFSPNSNGSTSTIGTNSVVLPNFNYCSNRYQSKYNSATMYYNSKIVQLIDFTSNQDYHLQQQYLNPLLGNDINLNVFRDHFSFVYSLQDKEEDSDETVLLGTEGSQSILNNIVLELNMNSNWYKTTLPQTYYAVLISSRPLYCKYGMISFTRFP